MSTCGNGILSQAPYCGYEAAQFDLTINEASSHALVDEIGGENVLKSRNVVKVAERCGF